jgi:hypothetical protein
MSKNNKETIKISEIRSSHKEVTNPIDEDLQNSFSNVIKLKLKTKQKTVNWFIVGASSIGKSHISINQQCQDYHTYSFLKEGWGISVVSDGAGSAENSHLGSKFVCEEIVKIFKDFYSQKKIFSNNRLPHEAEWQSISNELFKKAFESLVQFAHDKNIELSSVACTVIVVIFTPIGLLTSHIGDGRAGYCNSSREWKPLLTPHKGEEANQTIFITSLSWISNVDFRMSNVLVPESKVINEKAIAFTLMTDGCETHAFNCSKIDERTMKWMDPNIPSEIFFNPLLNQLKSMFNKKVPIDDINNNWKEFIEEGTIGLKEEPDDKSLILGILV